MIEAPAASETPVAPGAQLVHVLVRLLRAVRYRKNVVLGAMLASATLGALYYATATRRYAAKAEMLVTQIGPDRLETTIAAEESVRRNTMPTFETMFRSAKVVEGALKSLAEEDRLDLAGVPSNRWVETLQGNLAAKNVRNTNLLAVSCRSKDPRVAVNVLAGVVQSYLDFMDQVHKGTTGDLVAALMKERGELVEKINRNQATLLEARRASGDMGFRSDSKALHPLVQRAVFFNDALINLQKRRVELEVTLAALEQATLVGEELGQHVIVMADLVGKDLLMGLLGVGPRDALAEAQLAEQHLRDQAELAMMRGHLGDNHPEVVSRAEKVRLAGAWLEGYEQRVNDRIASLGRNQVGPWIVEMARQKLQEIRRQESLFEERFAQTQGEAIALSEQLAHVEILEHEMKRLGDLDDALLNQIAALKLRQNGQEVRTTLSQEPTLDETPISPKLTYVVMAVVVAGFAIGLAAVHLLDVLDDRFRSIDEMQQRLGAPALAMIQRLAPLEAAGLEGVAMFAAPAAGENEAFRTLRTALALAHPEARQIVITSAEPGDGKTTVLANLAVGYAQSDKRTLLVDADLRRPGLTRMMDLRGPYGLSEILRSDDEIAAAAARHIQPSGMAGLDVLPCGPRPSNPAELLASPRLSQLLAWAAGAYDQVLVDSPPALATSDTAVVGRLVDGVILVVQPAKNRRGLVVRLSETLAMLKIPLLGVVVNRAGSGDDGGYYGYHADYGYGYDYAPGYGHDDEELSQEETPPLVVPRRAA